MAKENGSNNTVWVVALVLSLLALVLGFTGKFGGGTTQVAQAPAAVAPAAAPTPAPAPSAPAPAPVVKLSQADYDSFLEGAVVKWNKDAKATIIEFSDVQCPFCQRHVNNGTLDQVQEKYGDDVNVIFAHFPLSFHQNAQKAGEAIECANKIGGEEAYFEFKKAYFKAGGDSSMAIAQQAATDVGLDADALMECVDGGEFAQKVKDQMAFGQKLGVTGTPGNVVINNETLDTQKISGAVPAASFDAAIGGIIN